MAPSGVGCESLSCNSLLPLRPTLALVPRAARDNNPQQPSLLRPSLHFLPTTSPEHATGRPNIIE